MSGPCKRLQSRSKQENKNDSKLTRTQSLRVKEASDSSETRLREQMAQMEEFYKNKLSDTRSQLKRAEEALSSFKDRMAEDLSVSLDAAIDTENMTSPVNLTRLQDMYHHLRVNEWPKIRGQIRYLGPDKARNIIQGVFKAAVTRMDSVKMGLLTIFTENMPQKELPIKVQDHLRCSLHNLQLALFHCSKQDLPCEAVMDAPETCRALLSELYWLFCLMVLSKTPLQPQWDSYSTANPWDCLPDQLTQFTREDLHKPSHVGQRQQSPLNPEFTVRSRLVKSSFEISEDSSVPAWCRKLKSHLQQKFSQVWEGGATAGDSTSQQQIYTELFLTEQSSDAPLLIENVFKERPVCEKPKRTVLTVGAAGVGKTVLTQKFCLDWAEGRTHQDIQLLLPFTFRELIDVKDRSCNLVTLLHHFYSQTKDLSSFENLQVLFIFDGLDECRPPLDFSQTRVVTDPTESASVEELLVNLIRGSLLPSARLWITTCPAAATNQIPAECVTKVRGFNNPQKQQFFRKSFTDEQKATDVMSHIQNNPSLRIMSRSPAFCWALSNFIHKKLKLPTSLTQLYIHFLQENFPQKSRPDDLWKILLPLGRQAFKELSNGNLTFHKSDLKKGGLDDSQVSCFTHPNVKEFLAALCVHHTFFSSNENLLSPRYYPSQSEASFYRSAVDHVLKRSDRHLDLLLHFLLGLSLSTNQTWLPGLLTETGSEELTHETVGYIKDKLNDMSLSAEKSLNLLQCLSELNDHSLLEEMQTIKREGRLSDMSPAQWSALSFLLLSSDADLEEFDLKKFCPSDEGLQKLLLVVKASRKANLSSCNLNLFSCNNLATVLSSYSLTHLDLSNNDLQDSGVNRLCPELNRLHTLSLSNCNLTERSCSSLASVLSSSSLTDLDLSNNDLRDSGVDKLCEGLKSATCRLHTLRLSGCLITELGGDSLASALNSTSSRLRQLDLRYNHPGPSKRLTALRTLQTLRVEPAGDRFMTPGLRKYFCELSLDPNTANKRLKLSENNRKVTHSHQVQCPDNNPPVFCSPPLNDRCYWEVHFCSDNGRVYIGVTTSSGKGDSEFDKSPNSWALRVSKGSYTVFHDGKSKVLPHKPRYTSQYFSARVAVYLDYEAGSLSFYKDFSGKLPPLYSFQTTFIEPVYAGFRIRDGTVTLCTDSGYF